MTCYEKGFSLTNLAFNPIIYTTKPPRRASPAEQDLLPFILLHYFESTPLIQALCGKYSHHPLPELFCMPSAFCAQSHTNSLFSSFEQKKRLFTRWALYTISDTPLPFPLVEITVGHDAFLHTLGLS